MPRAKVAVVLFDHGGPDRSDVIRPCLFNLFRDPAILRVPNPMRLVLAHFIALYRTRRTTEAYDGIGGASPILSGTQALAKALEEALSDLGEVRAFIAMRYWHPMSDEAVFRIRDFDPDRVVLLPLYPQWSAATTGSSFGDWRRACRIERFDKPTSIVCCYPSEAGFVTAAAGLIRRAIADAIPYGPPRVLFSVPGPPKTTAGEGDPYRWHCESGAAAIVEALEMPELDWSIGHQGGFGLSDRIEPTIITEILRAGRERVPLVVVPIGFVSERPETLLEIDIDHRRLAEESGVPHFVRVPTVGAEPAFIDGLARLVRRSLASDRSVCSQTGGRICPRRFVGCPAIGDGAFSYA